MAEARQIKPQWEEIFESFGDGIVILDDRRRLIGMNPAAESITGFSAEAVLGHDLEQAFPGNEGVLRLLRETFDCMGAVTLREMPWKEWRRDRATVDLSVTPLMGDEGEFSGWILVLRDVTPLKNLEEEVRKADRLAMLGTIAAGLAHEIKNPLGGIKGAAQLLSREKMSSDSAECIKIIIRETERVNRLVSRLLVLTKPKTLDLHPINLNELLDSILLLEKVPALSKGVKLLREFDPSLPPVMGDDDELRQAFLNFIKNALEALSEQGGVLRVKTRMVTDFKIRGAAGGKPARVVLVEIQDDGAGMTAEELGKIFTPFYTTKSSGSGLGMAISQRIIQEHGGSVRVQSTKGTGTLVQVTLRSGV